MAATDDHLAALRSGYDCGFGAYLEGYRPTATRFPTVAPARDKAATEAVLAAACTLAEDGHPHNGGTVPSPVPELRATPRL